jgi:hypothetical protein
MKLEVQVNTLGYIHAPPVTVRIAEAKVLPSYSLATQENLQNARLLGLPCRPHYSLRKL